MKPIILTCSTWNQFRSEERFEITLNEFGEPEIRNVSEAPIEKDDRTTLTVEGDKWITLRVEASL
jgi:hypothetical protein